MNGFTAATSATSVVLGSIRALVEQLVDCHGGTQGCAKLDKQTYSVGDDLIETAIHLVAHNAGAVRSERVSWSLLDSSDLRERQLSRACVARKY